MRAFVYSVHRVVIHLLLSYYLLGFPFVTLCIGLTCIVPRRWLADARPGAVMQHSFSMLHIDGLAAGGLCE